jgi:hypothetical protein
VLGSVGGPERVQHSLPFNENDKQQQAHGAIITQVSDGSNDEELGAAKTASGGGSIGAVISADGDDVQISNKSQISQHNRASYCAPPQIVLTPMQQGKAYYRRRAIVSYRL